MDDVMLHKVDSAVSFRRVDIGLELRLLASQEGCDGHEYDMMIEASEYITQLRCEIQKLSAKAAFIDS